ncbi:MAG TPA: hypothetical protein PLO33_19855 [Kouleothrix sp.]|nr:hypothetical protein [Kouleothrix sp.]
MKGSETALSLAVRPGREQLLAPDLRVRDGAAEEPAAAPGTIIDLTLADDDALPLIAERTLAAGARLYALTPRRMALEQIFLEIVGNEDSGQ